MPQSLSNRITPLLDDLIIPNCFGVVYKITCSINFRSYIGQARSYRAKTTIRNHFYPAFERNRNLRKDVIICGYENFTCSIVAEADCQEELDNKERLHISLCQDKYNIAKGGRGFEFDPKAVSAAIREGMSPEVRSKMSERTKEQWIDPAKRQRLLENCYGMEAQEKRSETMRKLWADPEHRAKMEKMHSTPESSERHRKVAEARWAKEKKKNLDILQEVLL